MLYSNNSRISKIERISILTRLILKYCGDYRFIDSIKLAKDLASIIDELNFFKVNIKNLEDEFINYFPEHWKKRTQFLMIITHYWPNILNELNKDDIDPDDIFKSDFYRFKCINPYIDCISKNISSEINIKNIKNKINIFEANDIFEEINFISNIIKDNLNKSIFIVSPNKNLSRFINYKFKFENIKYTSYVDNYNQEIPTYFLDEISKNFGDFKNISEVEMKKLIEELRVFLDIPKEDNLISIIGINDIKLSDPDIFIITELNEDFWNDKINGEYWLHKSIRKKLKIPILENKKHIENDFYCIFNNKSEVYLLRSKKNGILYADKSSILTKFEASSKKENKYINIINADKNDLLNESNNKQEFSLNSNFYILPDTLSVNNIELLIKDPYAFYASKVLNIKPNDNSNSNKEKLNISLIFKDILISYYENKNKMNHLMDFVKNQDYFIYQKLVRIIEKLDDRQSFEGHIKESYNNLFGKIEKKDLQLYSYCDRVEMCGDFSTLISYKSTFNISAKDIIYGDDCSIIATCLIFEKQGFLDIKKPIREIQIWSIGNSLNEPLSIKTIEISKDSIMSFEKRLDTILDRYQKSDGQSIDLNNNNKLKFNKYKHFERI